MTLNFFLLRYILNSTGFFIRLSCFPLFPSFSTQFWLLQEKLSQACLLLPSTKYFQLLSESCMIGWSKETHLFPHMNSTGIANPPNSKPKWDLRFHFLTLTHGRSRLFLLSHQFRVCFGSRDAASRILGHWNEHRQEQTVPSILLPLSHRCKLFSALPLGESCPVAKCYILHDKKTPSYLKF